MGIGAGAGVGAGARLVGQFHATSPSVFGALFDWVRSTAVSAATSAGCAAPLVDFEPRLVGGVPRRHYPPTVNDARAAALALEVGRAMFGAAAARSPAPAMPGEDFGFFAARWPSAMAWVGAHNASAGAVWPLHSDKYVLDEGVLHRGVAMHVGFATAFLTRGGFSEGGGAGRVADDAEL
jgi:IAA-amino acid hydrolase